MAAAPTMGMAMQPGAMGRMMGSMMGASRRGLDAGGGAPPGQTENVFYVKPENDKGQYKILPILVTVLIDQDRVQDFLVELENSPMSIQVRDFELKRPVSRVTKPEKGTTPFGGFTGQGGMMGYGSGMAQMMMRRGMGAGGMSGYGGQMGMMQSYMASQMRGMPGMGMMGGMGGGVEKKGKDVRNVDRKKKREEAEQALAKAHGPILFDPHFDIVQITIYGQARFFLPPTEEPAEEASPGQTAAAPDASGAQAPGAGTAGSAGAPAQPGDAPAAKTPAQSAPAAEKPAAPPAGVPKAEDASAAAPAPAATKTDGAEAPAPAGAPAAKPEPKNNPGEP
jgi:hypothetical protein